MIVKTEPSVPKVEEKLSGYQISRQEYLEAVELLKEEGYMPKTAIMKRRSIPPFPINIPLKVVADFDPQIEGSDIVFLLREDHGDQ